MNDFLTIVKERRSIRNYEEKDVSEEALNTILEAARWAPSWTNTQCWDIVITRDKAVKEKLQQTMIMNNPATKAIMAAPVVAVICAKMKSSGYYKGEAPTKFGDWFMFDIGIVTQTMCLAAQSLGLGTVIVGLFDHNKANQVVNVPEGHEVVAILPIGYPAKTPSAPKRKEIVEFVHKDKF